MEVTDWSASPTHTTIFTGNVSGVRLIVNGTAHLDGAAVIELAAPITGNGRVRLVIATLGVTGEFRSVKVKGPKGDCNRYSYQAVLLPTLYAIDVTSAPSSCGPRVHKHWIIVAAVIGGVFAIAVIAGAILLWMDSKHHALMPAWMSRHSVPNSAYVEMH